MAEVVRFEAAGGVPVFVEVESDEYGVEQASRGADGALKATAGLERALGSARATIQSAVAALSGLGFEELELEFGIKLSAEAGAMIAKTAAEGHLTVTARWGRDIAASASPAAQPPAESG
jgi:hypothetical protein